MIPSEMTRRRPAGVQPRRAMLVLSRQCISENSMGYLMLLINAKPP
jgi:hypothetical protein